MPIAFSIAGTGSQSGTSDPQNVPGTSTPTLIGSVDVTGTGKFSLNGYIVSGSLSDFIFSLAVAKVTPGKQWSGRSVKRLSSAAGDFGLITEMINGSSATPHTTAAGSDFYVDGDLQGRATRLDIFATSAAGAVVNLDLTGVFATIG